MIGKNHGASCISTYLINATFIMKNLNMTLLGMLFLACTLSIQAQTRYIDEIFAEVEDSLDVTYGVNISILPILTGQSMTPQPVELKLDIYMPKGDTVSKRPVVLISHTGTFLPPIANQGATGFRSDSANVEMCQRFAKMGYVAVSVSNRLGWNALPTAPAETKRKTLLEAAYRGIQDIRGAIRFMRSTEALDGNPFRIDVDKFAVGGIGTGGYLSYGAAYLKRFEQINLLKFTDFTDPINPVPYIDSSLLGDVYGLNQRPLCLPVAPGYSSDFTTGFALGGALGDTSWIEAGDMPFISIHVPQDPFAPYDIADVIEPVNGDAVIDAAAGGLGTQKRIANLGLNDAWKNAGFTDVFTTTANSRNNGLEGLYPMLVPFSPCSQQCVTSIPNAPADTCNYDGGPWHWFNEQWFVAAYNSQMNPTITGAEALCRELLGAINDPVESRKYIDTCMAYIAPRIAFSLAIGPYTSIDNDLEEKAQLEVFPNPASEALYFRTAASSPIQSIEVLDATGRVLRRIDAVNAPAYTMDRDGLSTGLYFVKVNLAEGSLTERIMLK